METFDSIEKASFLSLFRDEGYPTSYPGRSTFLNIDHQLTRILLLFLCVWLIFMIISPGYPGRERWFYICRITTFLTIPMIIMVCYHAPYWESDSIMTLIKPRFSSSTEVVAKIGLNIGLLGFNVTLKSISLKSKESPSDAIPFNYNEQFDWNWSSRDQKKPKLSEETGHLKYQYKVSATKGLPIPFLWILDYFTIDAEEFRFARFYQQAAWYCHTLLWFSFGCWLLSSCLFCIVVEYGSLMMIITGLTLIITNMIWAFHTNPISLDIPFRSASGDKVGFLHPNYSWAYWINLINGLFCLLLGSFIYLVDIKFPDLTAQFFGIDIVQNYDSYFREIDEDKKRALNDQKDGSLRSTAASFIVKKENESNYVALRKKVTSNRLSKLHRLGSLRDQSNTTVLRAPVVTVNQPETHQEMTEPYYVVPKTVSVPIQPRVVRSKPKN